LGGNKNVRNLNNDVKISGLGDKLHMLLSSLQYLGIPLIIYRNYRMLLLDLPRKDENRNISLILGRYILRLFAIMEFQDPLKQLAYVIDYFSNL
jgi:hypothetical protein